MVASVKERTARAQATVEVPKVQICSLILPSFTDGETGSRKVRAAGRVRDLSRSLSLLGTQLPDL